MRMGYSNISCGVSQVYGLHRNADDNIGDLGAYLYERNPRLNTAFIIWSDVWGPNQSGHKLFNRIKKLFPNSNIQRTMPAKNPNSRNRICVYIWRIPSNFREWWNENYELEPEYRNRYF